MSWSQLTSQTKVAVILAALGFVLSFTSTSMSNINGLITCSHSDLGALVLGVLACLAGGVGLAAARTLQEAQQINIILCVLAVGVGALHIMRGLGMVGGPCG